MSNLAICSECSRTAEIGAGRDFPYQLSLIGWVVDVAAAYCIACQVERAKRVKPDRLRLFMDHAAKVLEFKGVVRIEYREDADSNDRPALFIGIVFKDDVDLTESYADHTVGRVIQDHLNALGDGRSAYQRRRRVSKIRAEKAWY